MFRYLQTFKTWGDNSYLADFPKLSIWSELILRRSSVIKAAPEDYGEKLKNYLKGKNSFYTDKLAVP